MDPTESLRRAPGAASPFIRPFRLAYFVSRFPTTTETFVVRELNAVAARPQIEADLFALFPTPAGIVQESARPWTNRVRRARPLRALGAVVRWFCRRPLRVLSTVALVVKDHAGNPGVLARSLVAFAAAALHAETIDSLQSDHVHAHFATYPALAAWVTHRLTGVSYSFTAHAHDLYVRPLGVRRRAAEAAFVASISQYNRRILTRLAGESADIQVIHCGVDTERYRFAPHAPPDSGPVRAICVASLREKKGHKVIFEALASTPALDRVEIDLVGDGPLRRRLEAEVARLGLGSRVRFHGDLTEHAVTEMLAEADLFVLPSVVERNGDADGIPVALMEAMAAGLPVVASRVSGVPELVREGETGLLADPGDPRALARKLTELLADPGSALARTWAARALVEREFSLEACSGRLTALFTGERGMRAQISVEPAVVAAVAVDA